MKRKLSEPLIFSATKVKNYILKDPLQDWINLYDTTEKQPTPYFMQFLQEKGKQFETAVVNYLSTLFPVIFVDSVITPQSCEKALSLIKQNTPVLHSVPFVDTENNTKGIIDLLIRSDYLSKFLSQKDPEYKLPIEEDTPPHYVVIDIKFSTLPLRADGIHLLNSGFYSFYKSQVYIYNQYIGRIQNHTPRYSYILGRRYRYTSKYITYSSDKCLDRLGTIDFSGVDSSVKKQTEDALNWLTLLHQDGKDWTLSPPSVPQLYPNMCINATPRKKEIADSLGDITQLWNCGIKHRENAFKNNIKSWRDLRCTSSSLGISGLRARIIDEILNVNRGNSPISPQKIQNNIFDWRTPENEMFVDFETFADIFADFSDLPTQGRTNIIFMIGVYYLEDDHYQYKNFVIDSISPEEEYRIMNEFITFIKDRGNPKLWYWHADDRIWEKAEDKMMDNAVEKGDIAKGDNIVDNWGNLKWADLCYIFREEPIVVKGCFKFGLKEIASAMKKNNLISTELESDCKTGIDASIQAWEVFTKNNFRTRSQNPVNNPVIKDIALYNKYDVKVLFEILSYLRQNL